MTLNPLLQGFMALGAVECLLGVYLAQKALWHPESFPARIEGWIRPSSAPSLGAFVRLGIEGVAWMAATAVSVGLCVPLLPIYTTFRWIDSFSRASRSILGR